MNWISVDDYLPPEGEEVLTLSHFEYYGVDSRELLEMNEYLVDYLTYFESGPPTWSRRRDSEQQAVKFWMDLPFPP